MDAKDQARLVYQALERIGPSGHARDVLVQLEQLQRGLPAEDEFAALCVWSGRCRLIHKLSQEQFPRESKTQLQVPDFFAIFDVEGATVPVLIEVKSTARNKLRLTRADYERRRSYASSAGLPLLIAWRAQYGIWSLFDVRDMSQGPGGGWHADFHEIIKQTLMGVLLGEFHATVRAGVGLTIVVRRLERVSGSEFIGRVEAAHWHDSHGSPVSELAGNFMPLLLCCPEEVDAREEGEVLVHRFSNPVDNSVPAHWTIRTSLLTEKDPNWLRLLREGTLAGGRNSVREAALDGIAKGMIRYVMDIEPHARPDFLPPFRSSGPR